MRDKEHTLNFPFLKLLNTTSAQMDSKEPLSGYAAFKQLKRTEKGQFGVVPLSEVVDKTL